MAYLIARLPGSRQIYALKPAAAIGRGVSMEVPLDDPRCSKRHAEIRETGGRFLLRDLDSTNGTLVNGALIKEEVSLQDGDEILVGSTTLTFTRAMPPVPTPMPGKPGAGDGAEAASPADKGGLQVSEKAAGRVPKGTLMIPLERFALHPGVPRTDTTIVADAPKADEFGIWLRSLYQLLREASHGETEDELFAISSRILTEALPGSRVRVLFEAERSDPEAERLPAPKRGGTLRLSVWSDPARRTGKTTRILDDRLAGPRTILLTHAREKGVAVLSPDLEADARVATAQRDGRKTTRIVGPPPGPDGVERERLSLLIAPLLSGRTSLGFLIVERGYVLGADATPKRGQPFTPEHLEFLAAAAYPLATLWANIRRRQNVQVENQRLRQAVSERYRIVGESQALQAALSVIQRVAPHPSPVLILGESGTGKELAARALHAISPKRNGPFEAINCAALPENLVESELFGHVKGSFTGASSDRAGIFETASGGTLLLDEIGDLPLPAQAKLLRVIEEGKVTRVGESRLRDIDVRLVAATNRDLAAEVEAGRFRRDLYYRLRVMEVTLPSLRERLDDLPLLCRHLLEPFGNFTLLAEAQELLRRYAWPGNIRELRNTLERMAVLSRPAGRGATRGGALALRADDVPLDIRRAVESAAPASGQPAKRGKTNLLAAAPRDEAGAFLVRAGEMPPLEKLQVTYARWVLQQVKGNKTKAAKVLGIQRSTLYSWTEWSEKKV